MTDIVGTAVIQLGRPQVPLQISVKCQLLKGLNSHCRFISDIHGLEFVALKPPVRPKQRTRSQSLDGGLISFGGCQGH